MNEQEIKHIFDKYWKRGWGSVSIADLLIIQEIIVEKQPKTFVELGMASGMSAALIALMMEKNQGKALYTFDHNNTFFGDPSKENGFLIDLIAGDSPVNIEKHAFSTAVDVESKISAKFDMGFIDANHRHPWPTLDTICLYPLMNENAVLIYDDYALFRYQKPALGIGTKYLYDQLPESHRTIIPALCDVGWLRGKLDEVVTFDTNLPSEKAEESFLSALHLPWTNTDWLENERLVGRLLTHIEKHYSDIFHQECKSIIAVNNQLHTKRNRSFFSRFFRKLID